LFLILVNGTAGNKDEQAKEPERLFKGVSDHKLPYRLPLKSVRHPFGCYISTAEPLKIGISYMLFSPMSRILLVLFAKCLMEQLYNLNHTRFS
jgi:hypothetical protein